MSSQQQFTLQSVAQRLKQTEDRIKEASNATWNAERIMFSRAEVQELEAYFQEREEANRKNRRTIKPVPGSSRPRASQRNASVAVETRKARGSPLKKRAASRTADVPAPPVAQSPAPPPAPAPQRVESRPVPPSTPKAPSPPAVAAPSTASEQRSEPQSQSILDKIYNRNVLAAKVEAAKPPADAPKTAAQQRKPAEVQPAQNGAEPKLQGPQPVGTIRIDQHNVEKRDRKRRRRASRTEPRRQEFVQPVKPKSIIVEVPENIPVRELAYRMSVKTSVVNDVLSAVADDAEELPEAIDQELACIVVEELGHVPEKVYEEREADFITSSRTAKGSEIVVRPPVVTVMGHVDHGKTSLLDYMRKSKVTESESGGITQHIGAYQVQAGSAGKITFIDTPGHEVFTEMRARGAKTTDIVVLVVAADDGVQPQTKEAVSHAQAANVPIVVAVNKIDLPTANLEQINQQLASLGLQSEQWGGQTIVVPVSAITGAGIDQLFEAILLTAEVLELKAPLDVDARGSVIEVRTEKGLGPVVSAIVRAGVLRKGQFLLCDTEYGRVRALRDEHNNLIDEAGPSMPVQIQGIAQLPRVGCEFFVANNESSAREHAEDRRLRLRQRELASKRTVIEASNLDELFELSDAEDRSKVLNLVIKTDVAGSCEAIEQVIAKLGTDECKAKIVHSGVGAIAESDVSLAEASNSTLVGFRVTANPKARRLIADRKIPVIYDDVFYRITDTVKELLTGMLEPEQVITVRGTALVKQVFHINKLGKVAGCTVKEGVIDNKLPVRVVRDGAVVANDLKLTELRHYKDQVARVSAGADCGIFLQRFGDCKPGDEIESLEIVEQVSQVL